MIAEAFIICCIYILPFLVLITLGGVIFEVIIPAIAKRKARKNRENYFKGLK